MNPLLLADRLDWMAKYRMFQEFRECEGLSWDDAHMQSLDLAYHNVDPENGLYYGLVDAGEMRTLVSDARISDAVTHAPGDTRAFIRGLFVDRYSEAIRSIGWNGIAFTYGNEDLLFDMNPLVEENVKILNEELSAASSLDEVVNLININAVKRP